MINVHPSNSYQVLGSLGTTTAMALKRHLKSEVDCATSNFIVLIPSHSIHEMLVIFSGVEF